MKQGINAIEIVGLNKFFGGREVLKDINFTIEKGDIFGLVGVNGIGKTTLLKIILDLLTPDSGEVRIYDKSSSDNNSRANLSYLPEKFYPSQFLKGHEFLALSSEQFNKKYDSDKAKLIAQKLDLDIASLDQKIAKYSKGMGQKLGLISVFLSEAPLLILDEPMSGLDPHVRIRLKELLSEYSKEQKTIFFSSHILSDIDEISDKIAVIHGAEVIFLGKPAEFKDRYKAKTLEQAFLTAIDKA
ncbi:MAG: ABC transporter ATP-binding protein [Rickettsiales bacterium]|jgi:ABC-2 type transport system ATP-binding protein|nr:ABC transporter ATP-binding protein [Rickettsiales bacterium]